MSIGYIDLRAFVADLTRLHDLTATPPREDNFARVTELCDDVIERLTNAVTTESRPVDDTAWVATRTTEAVMVVGRGLFLLATAGDQSVSIVSDGASWTFERDDAGTKISYANDAGLRSWTLPRVGEVADTGNTAAVASAEAWQPTHRVGPNPLPVGTAGGAFDPRTSLDPGLPVRVLDAKSSGWIFVECSNGWRCYVPAWGLETIGDMDHG
jgi:hypothetical protein